ncbi:MAG: TIM barrel protein [Thermomicrobiales bacterium]
MRIGTEGDHIGKAKQRGGIGTLDFAHAQGLDGVFFKSILDVSPTLDMGELREAKAHADSLGLYFEVGIGRINPYNTAESPHVRNLGGGDYRKAMVAMIEAARDIDCTELWAETATYKSDASGYFVFDRFRSDVSWNDQLMAIAKFLTSLAPVLRDQGCRVNIETHEEITSFEVVRLVESVGPDVAGATLDTANVLARCEDPVAATRRLAPYTHTTHIKDAILIFGEDGLLRQVRACGEGVVDWDAVIGILAEYSPNLNLSLEDSKGLMSIPIYDPVWQAAHPDLTPGELAEVVRLATSCEGRIARGEALDASTYEAIPLAEQQLDNMRASVQHLRAILEKRGLVTPSNATI